MMHNPVLLKETIEYFNPKPGQKFIDATINGGGHAAIILEKIAPNGKLLGIEQDQEIFEKLKFQVSHFKFHENIILVNDNFKNLKAIAETNDFLEADGILFDLGLSSWHLNESKRGFSFKGSEPLDMRFSKKQKVTAADIVNTWKQENLEFIFKKYGGEQFSKRIAENIIKSRKQKKIEKTQELTEIISKSVPGWYKRRKIHFATKSFQALRIAVNQELEILESSLEQAMEVLKSGGRLAVISFHSGEDKIVKNKFNSFKKLNLAMALTSKPIAPNREEIRINPRSRSAKLRILKKI